MANPNHYEFISRWEPELPSADFHAISISNPPCSRFTLILFKIFIFIFEKTPEYIMSIPDVLPALILFEITFKNTDVALDFKHMDSIIL